MRHLKRLIKIAHVRAGVEDRTHADIGGAVNVRRRIVADKPHLGGSQPRAVQRVVEDERLGLAEEQFRTGGNQFKSVFR